jgi:two-component system OmpR family response regulator
MIAATSHAPRKTILVVDDDTELRVHISDYLSGHGFSVEQAADGAEMDAILERGPVDLIVLDVMLPEEDGLAICRRLSRNDAPPILMLSAMGEEIDRVLGLELGADSYLAKPCSPRELLAHIRVLLRRRDGAASTPAPESTVRKFCGFAVDLARRQVTAANGSAVLLTSAEFSLLRVFLEHPNEIVSREELAQAASGGNTAFIDRSVEVLVGRLRRKLQSNDGEYLIRTYRGAGYRLDAIITK